MLTSCLVIVLFGLFQLATSASTTDGKQCNFPFIYEGVEYNTCTTAGSTSGKLWCSVSYNYDQDQLWGYCAAEKQTVPTTDGRQCNFPFIYEGVEYNTCTTAGSDSGKLWCSVSYNYDLDGFWGYCGADPQPGFSNCPLIADVTFIIEPFTSFTDDDWYTTSTFLKRFMDNFPVSSLNTRVAFLSTEMPQPFYLNKYFEREELKAFIDGWKRPQSTGSLARLFDFTSNTIYSRDNGDRADAENIVVVLINGQGHTDKGNEASVRAFLLQQKATMYIVGITQAGEDLAKELSMDQKKVIAVTSFRDLNTVVFPPLITSLCKKENEPGAATPRPATPCASLEVTDMTPNFGSILGGTKVTILGCQLAVGAETPTIYFGDSQCQIESLSSTIIICMTGGSVNAESTVVELKIQPTTSFQYNTERYFNYVYDNEAVITEIIPTPPKTMVSGSVAITMRGMNLPGGDIKLLMTISTSLIPNLPIETLCRGVNDTQFVCLSVDLTPFIPQEVRRKRSLVENTKSILQRLVEISGIKKRQKRQIRNARVDSPGYFEVTLGIQMLNNRKYTDLSQLFPLATKLQVYRDPNLFSFGGPQKFKPFPPLNQRTIKIKGERLNQGVRAEDYQIAVGNSPCKVVRVTYDELECEPPLEPDPPGADLVTVNILVGTIIFSPGEVDYDKHQWEDKGFRAGIAIFIIGFIIVVTLIWVLVACLLQRRINKADPKSSPPAPKVEKQKIKKEKKPKMVKPKKQKDMNGHKRDMNSQQRDVNSHPRDMNSHHNGEIPPALPPDRIQTPSQESEMSESRMNTGVSVEGYDRSIWAY